MLAVVDRNGDGVISYSEFRCMMGANPILLQQLQFCEQISRNSFLDSRLEGFSTNNTQGWSYQIFQVDQMCMVMVSKVFGTGKKYRYRLTFWWQQIIFLKFCSKSNLAVANLENSGQVFQHQRLEQKWSYSEFMPSLLTSIVMHMPTQQDQLFPESQNQAMERAEDQHLKAAFNCRPF